MKEHRPTSPENAKATEELLQQLEKFPQLRERVEAILKIVLQEGGQWRTASGAELALIEEMRKLGNESLGEWARQANAQATEEALSEDPALKPHSKKN